MSPPPPQSTPPDVSPGGGEVDLKLGMSAAEFVKAYQGQPLMVADCTYDDDGDANADDAAICGD